MGKFLAFIKKHKFSTAMLTIFVIAPVVGYGVMNKEKVDLHVFDKTLVWSYNRPLGENNYVLYRNGKAIFSTKQQTKLKDYEGDLIAPEEITEFNTEYSPKGITFTWNRPLDSGSVNEYYVNVESNIGGIVSSSDKVTLESSSGVSYYIVSFNNKDETVKEESFSLDTKDIAEGIYDIKIVAVDESGNKSNPFIKSIEIYKPYIVNNKIRNNSSKAFNYKVYLDGRGIAVKGHKIDASNFEDTSAPNTVSDIKVWLRGDSASLIWTPVKDNGTNYSVEIVGEAEDGEKVIGNGNVSSYVSGVSGYYYRINALSEYTVSSEDKFTTSTLLANEDIPYDNTYIHIAAVDKNGNIGDTFTKLIEKKESNVEGVVVDSPQEESISSDIE